jgi:glycosyltransferase involved in cell wall biosynthesis
MEQYIRLFGFQRIPYLYLAKAAVFPLSFRYRGFFTIEVKTLACGCPVVTTPCPGSIEILKDRTYREIVPFGDAEAFGRAILEKLDSPSDKEAQTQQSRDFSSERLVGRFEGLLAGSDPAGQGAALCDRHAGDV